MARRGPLKRGDRRPIRPREAGIPPGVRRYLLDLLAVEPCHVTGCHDPSHTPHRVCQIQASKAYTRTLRALGVDPLHPPRRAHPGGKRGCYWCHSEGVSEEEREAIKRWLKEGFGGR